MLDIRKSCGRLLNVEDRAMKRAIHWCKRCGLEFDGPSSGKAFVEHNCIERVDSEYLDTIKPVLIEVYS